MIRRLPMLLVGLVGCAIYSCSPGPADVEDARHPEQPFDSIAWNCQAGDSAVNGQLPFICP